MMVDDPAFEQAVLVAENFDPVELILDGDEPIEESDAVEVLLSWKQTRTHINKEKIARGFPKKRRPG